MSNSQLNFGLDLDYDRETHKQSANQQRSELYKLKLATRYKLIAFTLFILQFTNVLILFLFIYWDFLMKLHYHKTGQPIAIHFK